MRTEGTHTQRREHAHTDRTTHSLGKKKILAVRGEQERHKQKHTEGCKRFKKCKYRCGDIKGKEEEWSVFKALLCWRGSRKDIFDRTVEKIKKKRVKYSTTIWTICIFDHFFKKEFLNVPVYQWTFYWSFERKRFFFPLTWKQNLEFKISTSNICIIAPETWNCISTWGLQSLIW